jgi:FkbM family methyltransferase
VGWDWQAWLPSKSFERESQLDMNSAGIKIASFAERLGKATLRVVPRAMEVRILRGPLRGKKWIAGASVNSCWLGIYELRKQIAFCSVIQPGNVVYDLGANVGFYSLLASTMVGPTGRVFSFEPLPRNLALLRRHIATNSLNNCIAIEAAVASHDGTAKFETRCDSHTTKLSEEGDIAVKLVSLDGLVASRQILGPDVIKCDIEGAEFDALNGARRTLVHYRPILLLATHGETVRNACIRFLVELGYSVRSLQKNASLGESNELMALPS